MDKNENNPATIIQSTVKKSPIYERNDDIKDYIYKKVSP